LEPTLRGQCWTQQGCIMISHSQQPRKPTDNSMFSQIRTRAMTHETNGSLPCRGGGGGLLRAYAISPFRKARTDSHADHVDGCSKAHPASYSRDIADNAMGVSAPVALRLPAPVHVHSCGFLFPH
jgi:hypothetical protein